jgi:predicted transcriptional regulator
VFSNESERRSQHYASVQKKLTSWKKSQKCIYSGCENKSIRRSHSIQKAGSLSIIAQDGIVLTPEFNQEKGFDELVEKGISWASTFPGFCAKHETFFQSFENEKRLSTDEDTALQIYRSICREIVRLRHNIEHAEEDIRWYTKFRNEKLRQMMQKRLGEAWLKENHVEVKGISMKGDRLTDRFERFVEGLKSDLADMEENYLGELESDLQGNAQSKLQPVVMEIDTVIPVALSGFGSFFVREDGPPKKIIAILGVLPFDGGTKIFMHGKEQDTKYIHGYIARLKNTFDILSMIEMWMIRGTDHWFISPKVWKSKHCGVQRAILDELADESKGLVEPINYSIFDELRTEMIESAAKLGLCDDSWKQVLQAETAKLERTG